MSTGDSLFHNHRTKEDKMRDRVRFYHLFVTTLMLAVMAMFGCSGGGGGGAAPAASTQGVSKGVITKLGSIFVNGVEYDTTGATVTMETPDDASGLQVGMVVTVKGTFSDSTHAKATSVTYFDNLEGPIAAFDNAGKSMTVLGQKITFDSATVFDDFPTKGTSSVALGQMVEVSGLTDASGTIKATRIERQMPDWTKPTVVELKGTISTMAASTFTIGGLTVDASGVTLPAGTATGSYVKVEGTLDTYVSTNLKAKSVTSHKEGIEVGDGEKNHVDVEGLVSNLTGNTFSVGGTRVNAGTLSLAGIANGVKVEVEGTFANGVLMATKISMEGAVPPTTVPGAPVASAVGGVNQVTVSWNGVSGATSYNIYWSTTPGVTPANGTKITNVPSPYVHPQLTAGTTYYYVVTAVNSVGESAPSAQISAMATAAATIPGAPIGVSAVGGATQVTITWATVSGATSYNIYWSTTAGVTPATGTLIANATSPYSHTGLPASTTYYYVVTAVNTAGESAPSAQASATTAAATPPPPPACGTCHAIPPATGQHSFHVTTLGYSCAICHGTGYSSTTVNTTLHLNGVVNVVSTMGWNPTTSTCATPGCHGSRTW